jgi:hypothetical protein
MTRPHLTLLLLAIVLGACGKREAPAPATTAPIAAPAPAPLAPLDARLQALGDLSFVPADAEALLHVDLADLAAGSPEPDQSLRAFDFILRAQQPTVWQVLRSAGVTVGKELGTLYLIVAPGEGMSRPEDGAEPYLLVGKGAFDPARLGQALVAAGASVEPAPARGSDGAGGAEPALYVWRRPGEGAVGAATPPEGQRGPGDAAVGVAGDLIVFGPPALVRRALAARAARDPAADVRRGPLGAELVSVVGAATIWGAARRFPALAGFDRGHFHAAPRRSARGEPAPGHDLEGRFVLRARFGTGAEAAAFGDKLRGLLDAAVLLGERTPLGATVAHVRRSGQIAVEGTTLVATAALE